ncbi:MAG: DUF1573 domain-containing protein [Myxococcales bacterium]|nr:DUF1573 domain-containing protein [Myxococcales bacterium]
MSPTRLFLSIPLTLALGASAVGCGSNIKTKPDDTDSPATEGTPPDLQLSIESYDFGTIEPGTRVSTALTVRNLGSEQLAISSVTTQAPFSVTPSLLTVEGLGESNITVTVDLADYDPHSGTITFTSNDADEPVIEFSVTVAAIRDADGDGYEVAAAGGEDCDDTLATVNPEAVETFYDDVDQNCDGSSDWDQDGDGYETEAHNADPTAGGGDCQDTNADFYPGAPDVWYDNRDTNCDDADDYDADADGSRSDNYGSGTDCDDDDATVNSSGVETLNAKDDDCDGVVDVGASGAGAPYIYEATGNYDRVGYSTALADLNGDGKADVIVGAPTSGAAGPSSSGRGAIAVFLASPLPASATEIRGADNYFQGAGTSDGLGYALTNLGDFDNDGIDDLAVAATGTISGAGTVYVISGADAAGTGSPTDAVFTLTGSSGNAAGRGLGSDVDLDGDGTSDLVATYASGLNNAVSIVYGPATGSVALASGDAVYTTDGTETAFYRSAPTGGDLDGDGYDDLLLADGAADYGGYTDNGALWALFGQPAAYSTSGAVDIETAATVVVSGTANLEGNAWAVGMGDDIDGDGDLELWIYSAAGALYGVDGGVDRRSPFSPATEAMVTYTWGSGSYDADRISSIGDWTGDGIGDVMVVAEDGSGSYGRSEIFGSEIWDGGTYIERSDFAASLLGTSADDNGNLGYGQAAVPGDIDADGDLDLVTGDPDYNSGAGRAFVFFNDPVE